MDVQTEVYTGGKGNGTSRRPKWKTTHRLDSSCATVVCLQHSRRSRMDREGRHLRPTASPWEPYSSSSHASTCFHSSSRHSSHLSVLAFHLVGHTKLLSWATRQRMDLSEWIREENSQCNYQAVDAQRFHERKTQDLEPLEFSHQD